MRKLYTYMGSKDRHLVLLNNIINNSHSKNYCEPFLGSGSVFLNLQKDFEKYYLNDLQEENILAFKFAKQLNEEFIIRVFNETKSKFPLANKEMFYAFRDNLCNVTDNDKIDKAVYIFRIYNTCINGMIRFNKNKFNSAYGGDQRSFLHNLNDRLCNYIDSINYIKSKNIEVSNKSFEDLLNKKDCLYFFDPPYITNEMACNAGFDSSKLEKLIDFMLNTKEEFVYTDMLNNINKKLLDKFNYCTVDKIRSIRPKKGFDRKKEEIVVWNFKQKDIFNI